jgi:TolB-like protein/Flp pilus assembly protein TadD
MRIDRKLLIVGAVAAIAALLVFGASRFARSRTGPIDSLAVLPFTTATENVEYLSAGLTESVINSLLQLPRLRVIPRASVYQYRGGGDPLKAGRELGVRAVLTGNVEQVGNILVVQAELTDVERASALWGKRFQEKVSDLFAVQENIAAEIVKSLRLELSGEEAQLLAKRHTEDAEAYRLYLKGLFYWNKRSSDGIAKSIEFFERAIVRDPRYALPYAGLANAYILLAFYGALPTNEILPKARAAATRALELDERLAEAHTAVADLQYLFEWDWESAERGFRRAIELNPNYPTAHQWYANYLTVLLRTKEACVEIARAEELDPLDPVISMDVGLTCYYASGDYGKAIDQYQKVLELHPNFALAHFFLALAHLRKNDFADAVRELETTKRLDAGEPAPIAVLGYTFGISGQRREAEQVLAELRALSKRRYVSPFLIAWVHLGLGDKDRAFQWLEKAIAERAGRIVYLKVERGFDPLRSDPRFDDLLRRLKFPA